MAINKQRNQEGDLDKSEINKTTKMKKETEGRKKESNAEKGIEMMKPNEKIKKKLIPHCYNIYRH